MKKIAILFFGLTYHTYCHFSGKIKKVNYNLSFDNYQEYIYKYFENLGYEIDTYFTTNNYCDESKKNRIRNKIKPKNCAFIKNNFNHHKSRNTKFLKVIELCLNEDINYDLVLITRFDLIFQKKFEESNIKLDKFNLVSILEKNHLICDNFYLFPYQYLRKFYELLKDRPMLDYHKIKDLIESLNGKDFVNYILNEYTDVPNLTFYKLVKNFV